MEAIVKLAAVLFLLSTTVYAGIVTSRLADTLPDDVTGTFNRQRRSRSQQHVMDAVVVLVLFAVATGIAGVALVIWLWWKAVQ